MAERRVDRAASAPVLDPGYVGRLEEQVGADVVAELFADGLVELSDRLDRLADAARDRERDSALALAHDLTSVAGHLGLARLSLTAADCQRVLRRPDPGDLLGAVEPLLAEGAAAIEALCAHAGLPGREHARSG